MLQSNQPYQRVDNQDDKQNWFVHRAISNAVPEFGGAALVGAWLFARHKGFLKNNKAVKNFEDKVKNWADSIPDEV